MSYQLAFSGVTQHPGEIGMFYGCHFLVANRASESNEVLGLKAPRKSASAERLTFLKTSIVMKTIMASFNNHFLIV